MMLYDDEFFGGEIYQNAGYRNYDRELDTISHKLIIRIWVGINLMLDKEGGRIQSTPNDITSPLDAYTKFVCHIPNINRVKKYIPNDLICLIEVRIADCRLRIIDY